MLGKWLIIGSLTLILLLTVVQGAHVPDSRHLEESRVFFPLEINVPDVINGFLSAFRFLWGRLQSIIGYSGTSEIIGAKDPPKPVTPSPALQAVPLAPDELQKSPVQMVSVEVDDPVRHPAMHQKTKIKRTNPKPKKRKKKKEKIAPSLASEWELLAMEQGWM